MTDHPRMSKQTLQVLEQMLKDSDAEWYGLELSKLTNIAPGTLYPILHRLRRANWLETRTEEIEPSTKKRPARRLYRLTGTGELAARARLEPTEARPRSRTVPRTGYA